MLQKVNNSLAYPVPGSNYLLAVVYKAITPESLQEEAKRCRFDLFVRIRPGIASPFPDQQRTWCYRGDKFTNEEHKMLRNLLNLVKKKIGMWDRIELYDNSNKQDERIILKITDDTIEGNALHQYAIMLSNYALPEWLKIKV